jgi:ADP-ribose pyrophosphatase YjhB (NUDIX family)
MSLPKLSPEVLRDHKGISFVGITTCFFCYDHLGRFFMAKRSRNARDEHGTWEIGGGGLKWGLTAEENMRREVREEYNGEVLKATFLGYRDIFRNLPDGTPTHWLGMDFAALVDPEDIKINEPDMFDDAGWFTMGNLPKPGHSQQRIFFEKYADQLAELLEATRRS